MKQLIKYAALIFALILSASIIGGCLTAGVAVARMISEEAAEHNKINISIDGNSIWSRDENGDVVFLGISLGESNGTVISGEIKSGTEQFTDVVIDFMDIDVGSCDVIVKAWDKDYVSVDYENIPVEYKIYEEKGTLKINRENSINLGWNVNFTERPKIYVYAPASVTYEEIEMEKSSGSGKVTGLNVTELHMESTSGSVGISDVNAKELYVGSTSGSVSISGTTAQKSGFESTSGSFTIQDCELGDTFMDGTSGSINFKNVSANNLVLDTTSGRVDFSGNLTGNSVFESTSGSVNVLIYGNEEDYNLRVDMGSGSFYLNGEKEDDYRKERSGADNLLVFEAGSGRVSVEFQGAANNFDR